jgi:hypothetical protein
MSMLPHAYQLPGALLLVLTGALTCFAGQRLFRLVLAIYGLIFGALIGSSMLGVTNTVGMLIMGVIGGLVGAVVLVFAYFVGIGLIGAGLGAVIAHAGWEALRGTDPPTVVIILLAVIGAAAAMVLQRYVIIVATAFGGAWTIIVGGLMMADARTMVASLSNGDVWILYPLTPAPGARWIPFAWIALGLAGTAVQLTKTARRR